MSVLKITLMFLVLALLVGLVWYNRPKPEPSPVPAVPVATPKKDMRGCIQMCLTELALDPGPDVLCPTCADADGSVEEHQRCMLLSGCTEIILGICFRKCGES